MKLFTLAISVGKTTVLPTGTRTTSRLQLGWRISFNEEEAIGGFVKIVMDKNPGYHIIDIVCMEIPMQEIEKLIKENANDADVQSNGNG